MPRVLVIEDDCLTRELICRILEHAGFDVDIAADGAAGLHRFRAHPADVVICDIFMPEKDGLETIKELRREYHQVQIVALSGGAAGGMFDMLAVARKLGATATVSKPIDFEELLAAVCEALPCD
jgi:two-component system chemotaxis response regulator CheY